MDMSCLGKYSILANIQSHFQSCCVCWDRSKTFSPFPTIHISKIHTPQWEHVASGNSIEHWQDNLPMLPNLAYMYVQDTKHQTYNHFQRSMYGCTCHLQVPQHIQNPLKKWQPELWNSYETLSKFASSLLPAFGIYVHEVIAYKKHRTCDCSQQPVHKHELPFSLCCCYINWHHAIKTQIPVMVTELVPPIHIALVKRVQMPFTTIWQCPDLSFTLQVTTLSAGGHPVETLYKHHICSHI